MNGFGGSYSGGGGGGSSSGGASQTDLTNETAAREAADEALGVRIDEEAAARTEGLELKADKSDTYNMEQVDALVESSGSGGATQEQLDAKQDKVYAKIEVEDAAAEDITQYELGDLIKDVQGIDHQLQDREEDGVTVRAFYAVSGGEVIQVFKPVETVVTNETTIIDQAPEPAVTININYPESIKTTEVETEDNEVVSEETEVIGKRLEPYADLPDFPELSELPELQPYNDPEVVYS